MNGRLIRHIFHRVQSVPASCERSIKMDPRLNVSFEKIGIVEDFTGKMLHSNTLRSFFLD